MMSSFELHVSNVYFIRVNIFFLGFFRLWSYWYTRFCSKICWFWWWWWRWTGKL